MHLQLAPCTYNLHLQTAPATLHNLFCLIINSLALSLSLCAKCQRQLLNSEMSCVGKIICVKLGEAGLATWREFWVRFKTNAKLIDFTPFCCKRNNKPICPRVIPFLLRTQFFDSMFFSVHFLSTPYRPIPLPEPAQFQVLSKLFMLNVNYGITVDGA